MSTVYPANVIFWWQLGPGMKVHWLARSDLDQIVCLGPPREYIIEMRAIYVGDDPGPSSLQLVRAGGNAVFQMIGEGIKYAFAKLNAEKDKIGIYGDREAWDAFDVTYTEEGVEVAWRMWRSP
jgi:hypothetical protein